jgi:hypothetical protein
MEDKTKGRGKGKGKGKPSLTVVPGNVVAMPKGQGKNENGLTAKQEAFAQEVANGSTLAAAYRAAYNAENMAPHVIHNEACKLMGRQEVADRVNAIAAVKLAKTSHDAARIRISVIERLQIEANDTTNPASVRVRALELLGKITDVALFTERLQTESATTRSPDQITEELKERIAKLAG